MKKLLKMLLITVMCVTFALPGTACRTKQLSNDPHVLDIYLLYKGYQDEWLTSAIDKFKQESWVKEKYPDLDVTYDKNQEDGFAGTKLAGGLSINGYDLMFGVNLGGLSGTSAILDLTDTVYNKTIPGDGVTVRSKIPQTILDMGAFDDEGVDRYYTMCYVQGFWSMLYNKRLVDSFMGEDVIPVTTQEFLDVCAEIKTKGYNFDSPIDNEASKKVYTPIMLAHNGYWDTSFYSWWIQYEGLQGWADFFNGYYDEEISRQVLRQQGRLRSLEVIEDIFTSGYGYQNASNLNYIQAQTNFLAGNGVFHYNGDYLVTEMADSITTLKNAGVNEDIRYMKMPIISAIVEKLSFYNEAEGTDYDALDVSVKKSYDQKLAAIVRDIDNNVTYENRSAANESVSEDDWYIVASARQSSTYSSAGTQTAVIPAYSPAKEVAADFLIYMYSDKMIENFLTSSGGNILPSNIDWTTRTNVYSQLHDINKSKFDIMKGTSNYPYKVNAPMTSYMLGKAGLTGRSAFTGRLEVQFMLPANERTWTAKTIYENDINYWTEAAWGQLLARAGYNI